MPDDEMGVVALIAVIFIFAGLTVLMIGMIMKIRRRNNQLELAYLRQEKGPWKWFRIKAE